METLFFPLTNKTPLEEKHSLLWYYKICQQSVYSQKTGLNLRHKLMRLETYVRM